MTASNARQEARQIMYDYWCGIIPATELEDVLAAALKLTRVDIDDNEYESDMGALVDAIATLREART